MENNIKGRPTKSEEKRKRLQFSVWVSAEEKKIVDGLIAASNLPASQFFLALAIDKPMSKPKKRLLPQNVMDKITTLEKLAGLFGLSVLKTKDRDYISLAWAESSQYLKMITQLLLVWIFQEFDLPNQRKLLQVNMEKANALHQYLETILVESPNKNEILNLVAKIYQNSKVLLSDFEKHYKILEIQKLTVNWQESISETDIHEAIKMHFEKLIENLK